MKSTLLIALAGILGAAMLVAEAPTADARSRARLSKHKRHYGKRGKVRSHRKGKYRRRAGRSALSRCLRRISQRKVSATVRRKQMRRCFQRFSRRHKALRYRRAGKAQFRYGFLSCVRKARGDRKALMACRAAYHKARYARCLQAAKRLPSRVKSRLLRRCARYKAAMASVPAQPSGKVSIPVAPPAKK